jgi:hypothetical protein
MKLHAPRTRRREESIARPKSEHVTTFVEREGSLHWSRWLQPGVWPIARGSGGGLLDGVDKAE